MPMSPEISKLVRLQKLDDEIRAIEARLAKIPAEIRALEKEIATERKNLKDAEDELAEAQKAQRAYESDLAAAEEKREKYKDQLMSVKSNEEYSAMQKQIETSKKEVSQLEDKILLGLDTQEELERKRADRKEELERGLKEIGALEKELRDEEAKLEAERAERRKSREALLPEIPEDLLGDYSQIAKARGGIAMAEARDELCQVCRVRLRPQVYQELRIGDKIHHCGNCKRILYYREPETETEAAVKKD